MTQVSGWAAPFVTPEECDHEGDRPCSRCCPCQECGEIRYEEMENEMENEKGATT